MGAFAQAEIARRWHRSRPWRKPHRKPVFAPRNISADIADPHPGGNCGILHAQGRAPALGPRPLSDRGQGSGSVRSPICSNPSLRRNGLAVRPPRTGHHHRRRDAPAREPCRPFAREFASVLDRARGRGYKHAPINESSRSHKQAGHGLQRRRRRRHGQCGPGNAVDPERAPVPGERGARACLAPLGRRGGLLRRDDAQMQGP